MPKDFKASQTRTSALIGSGTQGSQPGLLIYSASDATNFEGGYQASMLSGVGSDVFLFVSGSKNNRTGVTLFGGDLVVSGSLFTENLIAEVDLTTTGSSTISGSLIVSASATMGGGLIVNNSNDATDINAFTVIGNDQKRHLIHADPSNNTVFVLSGGAPSSLDQTNATDTSFFVSGTVGSKASGVRGVSVFGGDVVISGSLTDGTGKPIVGSGGGETVGWFSGSSATHGSLGIQPNFISTSGSLAISGSSVDVAGDIRHIGDVDTKITFDTDEVKITAGGTDYFKVRNSETTLSINPDASAVSTVIQGTGKLAFGVEATSNRVLILSGGAPASFDEASGADVAFYTSGSVNSKGTTTRGTSVFGGDVVISGTLHGQNVHVSEYIYHSDDTDTFIQFNPDQVKISAGNETMLTLREHSQDVVTVGGYGSNVDFQVSGSGDFNTLYVDASEGRVGMGTNLPDTLLHLKASDPTMILQRENNSNDSTIAFQGLAGNTGATLAHLASTNDLVFKTHNGSVPEEMLRLGSHYADLNRQVIILSGASVAPTSMQPQQSADIAFFVSGAIDSVGTTTKGAAVFGGDLATSGALYGVRTGGGASSFNELAMISDLVTVSRNSEVPNLGSDVFFFMSGTIDSVGTSTSGAAVFGGDLALSGALYGVMVDDTGGSQTELAMISDVVTFSRNSEIPGLGNEVFFFVSGASPVGNSPVPSVALFDGRMVSSGNISVVQNYPATGAQLTLNNMTTIAGDGGGVRIDLVAGVSSQGGDGSKLFIAQSGPNTPVNQGGPYANTIRAGSGSLYLMVGSENYQGDQNIVLRDSHNTVFLATSGSSNHGDASVYFLSGGAATSTNIAAMDTNFIVSGSIGSAGTVSETQGPGTALFGGDLVASGAFEAKFGITGSLTKISDGSSYLIAGDNVTITSASNGSITIAAGAGGGGSLAVQSGSTSVGSVTQIDFTRLGLLTNLGSGAIALTGTIGLPEDGTYEDGLFTSFNSNTEIGHAIDKINEVLYYLSPSPAPNLSNIGNDGLAGVTPVRLSLGSSTTAGTSGYTLVSNTAGLGAAVDVNEIYQVATSSNNIRMGVFTSLQNITGDLADNVAQNAYSNGIINYSGSAFGDADQGTLKLEVNGTVVGSAGQADLTSISVGAGSPGSGTGTRLDADNNGFFQLSQTGSSMQSNGQEFGLFKYRTGKFRVSTGGGLQRTGWNYARVIHTVGGTDRTTNYLEWFNDTSNRGNPVVANAEVGNLQLSGSKHISGVEYATGSSGEYRIRIDRFYDNVYAQNPVTFNTTNVNSISSQNIPSLPSVTDSRLNAVHMTASFQVDPAQIAAGNLLSGTAGFTFNVTHPTKANMTSTGSASTFPYLLFDGTSKSNNQFEDFIFEDKRLPSASYDTQAVVNTAVSTGYNSEIHVTSSAVSGYSDGLMFFGGKLKAPVNSTNSGNFAAFSSLTSKQDGAQPDYSGLTSGTRTFFRAFKNESGAPVQNFALIITGSGTTIVHTGTALNTSNIRVFVKAPETTGYLDLGQRFKNPHQHSGQFKVDDYDGLHVGTFTDGLSGSPVTNFGALGTGSLDFNEHIILKVEADAGWTGNLEGMNVIFPAFDPSTVQNAPALDELDITSPSFAPTAKLSFGAGKTSGGPSGFINVTGSSAAGGPYGFTTDGDIDFNGAYTQNIGVGSNKRYGVKSSNGLVEAVSGSLNGDVTTNGNNYTADAFRFAQGGTLNLYVNASGSGVSPVHSLNLATFAGSGGPGAGAATSENANGSGFENISVPTPASSSTGIPDFRYFFRTANFKVGAADQNAKGWNWAKVVHVLPGFADETTTFIEWVNDDDGNAIDVASSEAGSFGSNTYYYQSGVKYFNSAVNPTGSVKFRVADAYSNVYAGDTDALALSFSPSNVTAQSIIVSGSAITEVEDSSSPTTSTSFPNLTATGNVTADIFVTGNITYTGGESIPGDASPLNGFSPQSMNVTLTAKHPIDANSSRIQTFSNVLSYSGSAQASNSNTVEKFTGEFFRMQSGSFGDQAASGSLIWDASQSLVGADAGHNSGLIVYGNDGAGKGFLLSPKNSALPNGGDFRTASDLTSPEGNVDYTSASGERHFFRTFKNNTTSDQAVISLVVKGDANLVPRTGTGSASLGSNKNVYIFVKIPGKTGWLDIAKPADGSITDGGGALQGDRDATIDSLGATNEVTFSTAFIGGDPSSNGSGEHFCIAIHADSNWTGYINEVTVTY